MSDSSATPVLEELASATRRELNETGPSPFSIEAIGRHIDACQQQLREGMGITGPLTADKLAAMGIDRVLRARLCRRGVIKSVRRGVYSLECPKILIQEQELIAQRRVPCSVRCLHSARRFWSGPATATLIPPDITLAVPKGTRTPRDLPFPVIWVRMEEPLFSTGVMPSLWGREEVRVYDCRDRLWVDYITQVAMVGPDHLREVMSQREPAGLPDLRRIESCVVWCGKEVCGTVEDGVAWLRGSGLPARSPFMRELRKWERRQRAAVA